MISEITLSYISILFQVVMLAVMLAFSVRLIGKSERSLTSAFLTFFYALCLLTDLYWVIYVFMRPDTRMPFAANEIGEAAITLLAAAILRSAVHSPYNVSIGCLVGTGLFSVCNIALWITWSGEVVQDILVGITFAYLLYSIAVSIKVSRAFKRYMWIITGTACALLVVLQGATFIVPENLKSIPDTCAYIVMTAMIIFLAFVLISSWKRHMSAEALLCDVFALFGFALTSVYMSEGLWYLLFQVCETVSFLLILLSVRKVVDRK